MKSSPARHFLPFLESSIKHSADDFLAYVEGLIYEKPQDAADAAEAIPLLGLFFDDADRRADALGIAASALIVGHRLPRAWTILDEAEELASTAGTKALLKSRRAHYFTAKQDWNGVRDTVHMGLELLENAPDTPENEAIRCRLKAQSAYVLLFADNEPIRSAKRSLSVARNPAASEQTRKAALANLASALIALEPRVALSFLDLVYSWRPKPKAGFADYVLAWIDGHLRALASRSLSSSVGKETRRMARRRMMWAANGLFEMGKTTDALMALVDLLTLGFQGRSATGDAVGLAERILTSIHDDPDVADEVQRQAVHYLESRSFARANRLRTAVTAHVPRALFPRPLHL